MTPGAVRTRLSELSHVSKVHAGDSAPIEVLHDVSLSIDSGEFVAIVGASGSGKSTLRNTAGRVHGFGVRAGVRVRGRDWVDQWILSSASRRADGSSAGFGASLMRFLVVLMAGSVASCASAPARPEVPLAHHWSVAPDAPRRAAPAGSMWLRFESRELGALIKAASEHSLANASAAARAAEQRALERVARAAEYPSLIAEVDVAGQSDNNQRLGNVRGGFFDAGLTAAYDVDVWGKNRQRTKAAHARSEASRFERAAIALDVTAAVAETYFEILSIRERIAKAPENLAATERVLAIVEARLRAGAALAREVAQQKSLVAAEATYLERLVAAESELRVSLALLLGREPNAIAVEVASLAGVVDPAITSDDLSVPATLLSRRPDVARAEAELRATHSDVEAARAALFPQLRLSATASVQSVFASNFYDGSGVIYAGVASLTQPIFDGGGLSAEREAAAARRAQAEAEYRRVALEAAGEVERALRARAGVQKQYEQQQLASQEARRAFELLEIEYQAGAGEMLAVLDAQRTLFRTEDELSQLHLAKLRATVALVKALGAGAEPAR